MLPLQKKVISSLRLGQRTLALSVIRGRENRPEVNLIVRPTLNFFDDVFGNVVSFLRNRPRLNQPAPQVLFYGPSRSSTSHLLQHFAHLMRDWPDRDELLSRMMQYHAGMSHKHKATVTRGLRYNAIRAGLCTSAMGMVR